jgi:RND superfamily putative drug exporter
MPCRISRKSSSLAECQSRQSEVTLDFWDALRTLARFVLANPRKVAATWLILAIAGGVLGLGLSQRVTNGGYEIPGSESAKANDIAAQIFDERSQGRAYVVLTGASPKELLRDADRVKAQIADSAGVVGLGTPVAAPDGSLTLLPVTLEGDLGEAQNHASTLQKELHSLDLEPARADLIGQAAVYDRYRVHSKEDLTKAALISFPITLAILLAAFLSVTAALIPLALAVTCLAVAFGGLYLLTFGMDLNVFVEDIVLVLVLGLSIDFSLFLVTRVRESLARERNVEAAVVEAMCTAGKAIAMSGVTVAAALGGLFLVGVSFFSSMAIGAIGAVLVAVMAALTLAPATIVLLSGHLDRFQIRPVASAAAKGMLWRRLATFVVRHRIAVATVLTLGLLVASAPAPSVAIGFRTFSALPSDDPVRQASEAAGRAFGPGAATPAFVVSKSDGTQLRGLVARQPGVAEARPPQQGEDGWVRVDAVLAAPPDQNAAEDVVERMRSSLSASLGSPAWVGGPTAEAVDFSTRLDSRTPLVVLVTLLLEIMILTVLLRAPVIALKAAATTLLSVTATIGIVALVFGTTGEIGFFVPVMLFTIVFGLSTDYEVFLLSRVRENYLRGQSNMDSLMGALVKNSRAITLAGMTMAVVFFAFGTSSLPSFTQIGFGVGTAILIDVTLVRGLLVPATVALLGDANWWWPGRRPTSAEVHAEGSSAPPR